MKRARSNPVSPGIINRDQQIEMQPSSLARASEAAHRRSDAVAFAATESATADRGCGVVIDQQQMRGIVGRLRRRLDESCCLGQFYSLPLRLRRRSRGWFCKDLVGSSWSIIAAGTAGPYRAI